MARKRQQLEPQADSQAATNGQQEQQQAADVLAAQAPAKAIEQWEGNVSAIPSDSQQAEPRARARAREVSDRLRIDGRWPEAELLKNDMIKEARANGMTRPEAQEWAYSELDRLYPPMAKAQSSALLDSPKPSQDNDLQDSPARNGGVDSGRVQGLGDLPPGWPELPANASLAAEIGWVQANRLYVVEELERGGTRVHLDRAHEPAPSRAAIGWLETSIRSYAKYVEVAAKATGAGQDEQAQERQERMDLDAVRALLAEMLQA